MRGAGTTGDGLGGQGGGLGEVRAPARVVQVIGGSAGIAAQWLDARALADRCDRSADRQEGWSGHAQAVAADPDLLESGLLSPRTAAEAEAAVLAVVAALGADARWWHGEADAVRSAVALLHGADEGAQVVLTAVDHQLGETVGYTLVRCPPLTAALALGAAAGAAAGLLPDDRVLTDHPTLVTRAMDGSGGLLQGLAAGLGAPVVLTPRVEDGAWLAAAAYGDEGDPVVRRVGVSLVGDARQPASVRDLVDHLGDLASLSQGSRSALNGTIEVQTLTGADGRVRHVVYLPGTDDLTTTPWSQDADVRDMATNLQLMAGEQDTYQRGIVQALHDAGVRPGEPVALVGHSQGGMEAAALLARHHAGLHVTDVVTAGSPTAQVGAFPAGSHVLSLEQRGDIVPLLDGQASHDSVPQTTVVFDARPDGGVLAHHGYPAYVAGAEAVDASADPSVRDCVASLRAHGFLGDGTDVRVTAQVLQITRSGG